MERLQGPSMEPRLWFNANCTCARESRRDDSGLLQGLALNLSEESEMGRQVAVVLYVVAMAAAIVGVDFVFFRNRFWERLTVNIGIVLVFAAFYLRFLRRP
jgi:hypothetical protein